MAIQRRIPMRHGEVFPHGAYLIDEFAPVGDYDAPRRPDGSRPQATDPETGLPVWSVAVIDADPEATKKDKSVTVKVAAKVQPVPPQNKSGTPFTLVEFTNITATPWIDDSGPGERGRLAWSLRATGVVEPGSASKSESKAAA